MISTSITNDSLLVELLESGDVDIFLTASDQYGESVSDTFNISIDELLGINNLIPTEFRLGNAYPNPFNPVTNFLLELPEGTSVKIYIYDILGRKIDTIFSGYLSRGKYSLQWNASSVSSGIYFINLQSEKNSSTQKITLVK